MRARDIVVASLAVSVALGGVAGAAAKPKPKPKPVCDVVKAYAGDARFDPTSGLLANNAPYDPNGDILSADIASDAKYVTAVVRVKSLATPDTTYPGAHFYLVQWIVPGHSAPVYLAGTVDPNPEAGTIYGPQFVFGDVGGVGGAIQYFNIAQGAHVVGHVNTAAKTITMSVPISQLTGYGSYKPGTHFSEIAASSQAVSNGPVLPKNVTDLGGSIGWGWQEESDTALKDYIAGTPSCVKPGS